jgi:uncharacterized protein
MNLNLLEPSDYPTLKDYFKNQPYNLSVYSLLSLIAWNNGPVRTYYNREGDCLLIGTESTLKPEERSLILPLCGARLFTPEQLHDLAIDHGFIHYCFVPGDYLDAIGRQNAERWFKITEQPEFEDYVYKSEDLIHLKGNRYAKKRNLIHQFVRDYDQNGRVMVEDLKSADADACLAFLDQWCRQRQCDLEHDEGLACEKRALTTALTHMDLLEGRGIAVRIDGRINAFAIMSHLNEKMGVLNFEKAFSNIRGLYQFLDHECCKRLFSQYEFINKESDMNIPELAQSKKSYHPTLRIKSYSLEIR